VRKKPCSGCGVSRNLMITPQIREFKAQFMVALRPVCLPCLLVFFKVDHKKMKKLGAKLYKTWMEEA